MEASSLQDRLRDHAAAFNGLLSLISAKDYYGEDTTDQWKKKKQTKKEAAAARRAKLDPDSELNRNAKEVMDERAKNKRKLREMEEEAEDEDDDEDEEDDNSFQAIDGVEIEKPGEGLKKKSEESNKKQKLAEDGDEDKTNGTVEAGEAATKMSKKDAKREAKREKKAEKKAEKKTKKPESTDKTNQNANGVAKSAHRSHEERSHSIVSHSKEVDAEVASRSESEPHSPTFDVDDDATGSLNDPSAEQASSTTSISSTIPPSEKPKHIKLPADTTALRARLAAKIEALRAARKADGPDGKPIRTRQELIESRRAKQAQRKERKLELRKAAKLEEARKREEALASNSPGVMSPAVELDEGTGGFSFGRVAFGDGAQMSHDLSYMLSQDKKKGPSDAKTALLKVQNQKKRLQGLDAEKRADIADKEAWLTARRRVEGEKIRDDEAILKKTVKRKEAAKKKSEKAWTERTKGVQQAQKERQKKREDNIKQRREEKLLGKAGKKKGGAKKKKGGRPGFEGSFGVGGRRK
ncbi:ribosome biogenesis protein Rrp14-C [Pochonia chlamydosporia 170]|uniref:Ribosome biogenesis protein Rrp14-C n=1 Tax=Pochonia chlamydosporia 170 TaxID=1380566 RepID=A0A179FMS8_METCM|nr:ribosome biogenesis protein Rrp14-C [Pochonia chlamydosporia 170]OAQ66598.1 ribosome biogenesis protein Rrp14-C [Pochonia chlamydosporia 170]